MAQSTLAIIILIAAVIAYITNITPVVLTTLIAMLLMTLTNIITPTQAFSGFGGTAAMMIMGMNIVGAAFFTTGVSASIGRTLYKRAGSSEKMFRLVACVMAAVLGMFINPMAVISIFMPIIDSVESQSNGKFQRKNIYLPVGIAAIYGGIMTSVSTSATVTANGLLNKATGQDLAFLDPAKLVLPGVLAMVLILATCSDKLIKKWFDFESPELPKTASDTSKVTGQELNKGKASCLAIALLFCIYGFVTKKFNMGVTALTAACFLMATGCISVKEAISKVSWSTIIIVAAGTGFGTGLQQSGAADVLANAVINLAGNSPFLLCCICLVFTTVLSNLMANTSAVVVVAPIAIGIAQQIGFDVLPFVLATAVGAGFSVATILSNASVTITAPAGYRFKDFMKYGGLINGLAVVLSLITLKIFFF